MQEAKGLVRVNDASSSSVSRPNYSTTRVRVEGSDRRYSRLTSIYIAAIPATAVLVLWALDRLLRGNGILFRSGLAEASFFVLLWLVAFRLATTIIEITWDFSVQRKNPEFPRCNFSDRIPDDCRALVVVPVLLTPFNHEDMVERLREHYEANKDVNLSFAMLTDFADGACQSDASELEIIGELMGSINRLNDQLGDNAQRRFFVFHRDRAWDENNRTWSAPHRKVGKLIALNRWLTGTEESEFSICPQRHEIGPIRYVYTLDADNVLAKDSVRRLIEIMAHPENRPVLAADGNYHSGIVLLSPLIVTGPLPGRSSLFECLSTGSFRWAPPPENVANITQELLGEGCFHGKGIYDLETYHALTDGRFPLDMILSHDILEGAAVRIKVSHSIPVFERAPATVEEYALRWHRWMRGDWQDLLWLFRILPRSKVGRTERVTRCAKGMNSLLSWRLLDNARRNFSPVFLLASLSVGWAFTENPAGATALAMAVWAAPMMLCTVAKSVRTLQSPSWGFSQLVQPWLIESCRALLDFLLLPSFAVMALHSAWVSTWRVCVSGRKLLEWRPFGTGGKPWGASALLAATTSAFGGVSLLYSQYQPMACRAPLLFGAAWMMAPLVFWLCNRWSVNTHAPMPAPPPHAGKPV